MSLTNERTDRYDAIMRLRPAVPEDAAALTDLHLDVWDEAYSGLIAEEVLAQRHADRDQMLHRWRSTLHTTTDTRLVAEDDEGRLIGFTIVGPGRDAAVEDLPSREVKALYVRAEVYGTGAGHGLLTSGIGREPAYLWVLADNHRAIAFYLRQGFHFDGATKAEPVGMERRMVRR